MGQRQKLVYTADGIADHCEQITSFIKQRTASDDYAQYRGTLAKVRDDFEQRSKLLATEREQRETAKLSEACA